MSKQTRLVNVLLELINTLYDQTVSEVIDEQAKYESIEDILLRLIGIKETISLTTGIEKNVALDTATNGGQSTLYAQFLNKRDESSLLIKKNIHEILTALKEEIEKFCFINQELKRRRLVKLLGKEQSITRGNFTTSLILSDSSLTLQDAINKANTDLEDIRRNPDTIGTLEKQLNVLQLLASKVGTATKTLAEGDFGPFGGSFHSILGEASRDILNKVDLLENRRRGLAIELQKLDNIRAYLVTGIDTTRNERISLLQVIDLLIFLTDEELVQFDRNQQGKLITKGNEDLVIACKKILADSLKNSRDKGGL